MERMEDYDINEAREDFIKRMQDDGYAIVLPESNELQIDIDTEEHYEAFLAAVEILERNNVFSFSVEEHESRSGYPCRHITITLPFDVTPWQRIAMQSAMGSDPARELLSSLRLLKGDAHPTLLVEEKP